MSVAFGQAQNAAMDYGPEYGLRNAEFRAFDSMVSWIHAKTGARLAAFSIMNCLLSVDTVAYITNRLCMGPIIRKILSRVLMARKLFKSVEKCEEPLKGADMFTAESNVDVLYPITNSGIKIDAAANEDSWAYNIIINGLVCPSTREPIIAFARGIPARSTRSTEATQNLTSFNVPSVFKMTDLEAAHLEDVMDSMSNHLDQGPFNLLQCIEFENLYNIPQDRRFSIIYAQNIVQQNNIPINNEVINEILIEILMDF